MVLQSLQRATLAQVWSTRHPPHLQTISHDYIRYLASSNQEYPMTRHCNLQSAAYHKCAHTRICRRSSMWIHSSIRFPIGTGFHHTFSIEGTRCHRIGQCQGTYRRHTVCCVLCHLV